MRTMEVMLRALAVSLPTLKLPDPASNPTWEEFLRPLRDQLNLPHKQRAAEWQAKDEFYSRCTERLMAIKDAWRNPTMHVGQTYSVEQARGVWLSAATFAQQVADELHE
jgi:hypothetical protein